jgi:hypothetical protein
MLNPYNKRVIIRIPIIYIILKDFFRILPHLTYVLKYFEALGMKETLKIINNEIVYSQYFNF